MSTVSWQPPVYGNDVQTSAAYLQRLQDFLAMQTGGADKGKGGDGNSSDTTANANHKRKAHSENEGSHSPTAIKDRRQSMDGEETGIHSHERSASPTESNKGTGKHGKGGTSEKRKEQNRNAQRAFRERKERVLKDLEDKIDGLNKVNEDTVAENQTLKELVSRLQEENKRLQESRKQVVPPATAAPQSDFTFNVPRSSSSSNTTPISHSTSPVNATMPHAPTTFNDADIMSFLSAGPSAAEAQHYKQNSAPFQFVNPSPTGAASQNGQQQSELLIPSSMPSLPDDWLWNSSTFGTEIPQALPPTVTNLMELFGGNLDGNLASQNNLFAGSATSPQQSMQQQQQNGAFGGTGSAPSATRSFSPDDAYKALYTTFGESPSYNSSSGDMTYTNNAQSSRSASHDSTGNVTNNLVKQFVNREGSSTKGDSPDTTCSSNGSDPSENQPSTPGSSHFANIGQNSTKTGFPYQSAAHQMQGVSVNQSSAAGSEGNTPSSVLNSMPSLRNDALFNNSLDGALANSSFANSDLDFQALLNGSSFTLSPNEKTSDFMDLNDFLVASPAGLNNASPSTYFGSSDATNNSSTASSTKKPTPVSGSSNSSVPTLSSLSDTPSSSGSSPPSITGNSITNGSGNFSLDGRQFAPTYRSAPTAQAPDNIFLPTDIKYSNPAIRHIFPEKWDNAKFIGESGEGQKGDGGHAFDFDIDSLCQDMT